MTSYLTFNITPEDLIKLENYLKKLENLAVTDNSYTIRTPEGERLLSREEVKHLSEGGKIFVEMKQPPKKKLKQKHQLPFWAANWRNK